MLTTYCTQRANIRGGSWEVRGKPPSPRPPYYLIEPCFHHHSCCYFLLYSNNCKTTYIEVYQGTNGNGRLMARICSSFRSFQRLIMHDNAFVRLHSDGNSGVTGFTASYRITGRYIKI